MPDLLPPIPLSDEVLDAIDHALDACLSYKGDEVVNVGSEYTLPQLLDFLAGHDPTKGRVIEAGVPGLGIEGAEVFECDDPTYSERDLIRALVAEVRRLRIDPLTGKEG